MQKMTGFIRSTAHGLERNYRHSGINVADDWSDRMSHLDTVRTTLELNPGNVHAMTSLPFAEAGFGSIPSNFQLPEFISIGRGSSAVMVDRDGNIVDI